MIFFFKKYKGIGILFIYIFFSFPVYAQAYSNMSACPNDQYIKEAVGNFRCVKSQSSIDSRDILKKYRNSVTITADPDAKISKAGMSPLSIAPLFLMPFIAMFGIPQKINKISDIDLAKKCVEEIEKMMNWFGIIFDSNPKSKYQFCLKPENQDFPIGPDKPIEDVVLTRDPNNTKNIIEVKILLNPQSCKQYIAEKNILRNRLKLDIQKKVTKCLGNPRIKKYLTNRESEGYDERFVNLPNFFE